MQDKNITKKADTGILLKDEEWDTIRDSSVLLKHFADTTTYLCEERDVSCSDTYPIICSLLSTVLPPTEEESNMIKKAKELLREQLITRFQPYSQKTATSLPILASLLDIRHKKLGFLESDMKHAAIEALENLLDELPLKTHRENSAEGKPTPSKRQKLAFMIANPAKKQTDELKSYLLEPQDEEGDPLDSWKANENRFPRIALIAKKILAIPATSVPSERILTAGILINKLQTRLAADLVDYIIFLNKNVMPACSDECKDM
ncbi:zinc finger BED domain-containing protein 4-like [Dreissena polymorpha]|uniref:zinc finger BED domain-containing protein 4-like n=1 Tax=Dreissena polymorpha TaxID=45954 RepID=UPI002264BC64|nr:zinc finger BED domain-containing protein 4-like [Dreissena polymorpha]